MQMTKSTEKSKPIKNPMGEGVEQTLRMLEASNMVSIANFT